MVTAVTKSRHAEQRRQIVTVLRAWFTAFFRAFSGPRFIRGGSGHYNEQCHPNTYN